MKEEKMLRQFIYFISISILGVFQIYCPVAFSSSSYHVDQLWPALKQPWLFQMPNGIKADQYGNLYIANSSSRNIQKYTAEGKFITSWNCVDHQNDRFTPGALAVHPDGNIYVCDMFAGYVHIYSTDGHYLKSFGGYGSEDGQFDLPSGIAINKTGFLFITDYNNDRIQKFSKEGQWIANFGQSGIGEGEFLGPLGIAVDDHLNLYVSDYSNHRIQVLTETGDFVRQFGTYGAQNGQFNGPAGLTIDQNLIYIADENNNRIQKFSVNGDFINTFGNRGLKDNQFYEPKDITIYNQTLYIADTKNNRIILLSQNGQFLSKWGKGEDLLFEFHDIALDPNGNLYLSDHTCQCIRKFTQDGKSVAKIGSEGHNDGLLRYPEGIAIANNTLWVADKDNDRIQQFTFDGQVVQVLGEKGSEFGNFDAPFDIEVDSQGFIYISDMGNHRIQKLSSQGQFVASWGIYGSGDGEFASPRGMAIDANNAIFIVDSNNHRIQQFSSEGDYLGQFGMQGIDAGQFFYPTHITIDRIGNLFVSDTYNNRIQSFSASGDFMAQWGNYGNNPGELDNPYGLTISTNGKVFVADTLNHRVQVFKDSNIPGDQAIIVAGGGPYLGNNLWEGTQMCANFAYRSLVYQGFNKHMIYYMSSDTDLDLDENNMNDDVDNTSTLQGLEFALTYWANASDNLILYLIDHGGEGVFRMNDHELLSAQVLDQWLDTLQTDLGVRVILIYEACKSGSFLADMSPPENMERIVITSANITENAYFMAEGTVSFSSYFWGHIFKGLNIFDAFDLSRTALTTPTLFQTPQLDANGNGVANELIDQQIAQSIYIGNHSAYISDDSPVIGSVSPIQTITSGGKANVFAEQVIDSDGIAKVWAVVRPPNYSLDAIQNPVNDLPSFDLDCISENHYEAEYSDFNRVGTYQITIYAMDRKGNTSIPKQTTVSLIQPLIDKAILIAGDTSSVTLNTITQKQIEFAYQVLKFQGFTDQSIDVIHPDDMTQGHDATPSLDQFFAAINANSEQTQNLFIYMLGQGSPTGFKVNSEETLESDIFVQWLNDIQTQIPGLITILYDGDYARKFMSQLSHASYARILIASSEHQNTALQLADGFVSFSSFFFRSVLNGLFIKQAFYNAVNAMLSISSMQTPSLDDSGNGIGNESGMDGKIAEKVKIGCGIMLADDIPIINGVSAPQQLTDTASATLIVDQISCIRPIKTVWAIISPPQTSMQKLAHISENNQSIQMMPTDEGHFEAKIDMLTTFGEYHIAFIAEDDAGNQSQPVSIQLFQNSFEDCYELDNTYDTANIIVPGNTYPQSHNFYQDNDEDWLMVYGIENEKYTIKLTGVHQNCDPMIEIYDSDGITLLHEGLNLNGPGEGEYIDWHCTQDGIYYIRLINTSGQYGIATDYLVSVYRGIHSFPGFITGIIFDQKFGNRVPGVRISTNNKASTISGNDGVYVIVDDQGVWTLKAFGAGYEPFETMIKIIPLDETPFNIDLIPYDSDKDGIPDDREGPPYCTSPDNNDTDNDGLLDGWEDLNLNGHVDPGETDPCNPDSDNDGIDDASESDYKIDPLDPTDATKDNDNDGYSNLVEHQNKTNPNQLDAPGMTGYDYKSDQRQYTLHGDIIYQGCEQGMIHVDVFDDPDRKSLVIKDKQYHANNYSLDVPARDHYYVRVYMDVDNEEDFDSHEPADIFDVPIDPTVSKDISVQLIPKNLWHFSFSEIDDKGEINTDIIAFEMKDEKCNGQFESSTKAYKGLSYSMSGWYVEKNFFNTTTIGSRQYIGKGAEFGLGLSGRNVVVDGSLHMGQSKDPDIVLPYSVVINPEEMTLTDLNGFWSFTFLFEGNLWNKTERNGQQNKLIAFISDAMTQLNETSGKEENGNGIIALHSDGNKLYFSLQETNDGYHVVYEAKGSGTFVESKIMGTYAALGTFVGKSVDNQDPNGIDVGQFYARFTPMPSNQVAVGSPSFIVYSDTQFSIPVIVDTGNASLGTYSTIIGFNKDVVRVTAIRGKTPHFETLPINEMNDTGFITISDSNARSYNPLSGVIHLADLEFRVIGSPGMSGFFTINQANIFDVNSQKLNLSSINGLVIVGPALINAGTVCPMTVYYNGVVEIPLTISRAFNQVINSFDIELFYDPDLLEIVRIKGGKTKEFSNIYNYEVNETQGKLSLIGENSSTTGPIGFADVASIMLRSHYPYEGTSLISLEVKGLNNSRGVNIDNYASGVQLNVTLGICGDVNTDGKVDVADASLLSKYLVGDTDASSLCLDVADVNDNGEIDVGDAMYIVQYSLGNRDCICEDTERELSR